jgi:hypothetical protein
MADVFVSYASSEKNKAQLVAQSLEAAGFTVWWDRALKPGETFDRVIEREIAAAKAVVVLWTRASVESQWVREEADHGRQRENLVPLLMDEVTPPMGFGRVQAAKLAHWSGDPNDHEWQEVVQSVQRLVGRPAKPVFMRAKPSVKLEKKKGPPWLAIGLGVVAVGLLAMVMLLSEALKVMSDPQAMQQAQAIQQAIEQQQNAGASPAAAANAPGPSADLSQSGDVFSDLADEQFAAPAAPSAPDPSFGGDPYAQALAAINPLAGQLQIAARAQGMTFACVTPQGWCAMNEPGPVNYNCWCPSAYGPVNGMSQ